MSTLRHVQAVRYVTALREGGSMPGLCEADDDGLYVVKLRGAGQGTSIPVGGGSGAARPWRLQFVCVTMVTRRFSGAAGSDGFISALEPRPTALTRSAARPCCVSR